MNYEIRPYWDQTLAVVFKLGNVSDITLNGLVYDGVKSTTGAPAATAGYFIPGATIRNSFDGSEYINAGTTTSPSWKLVTHA